MADGGIGSDSHEVAERLGDHGARISNLEGTQKDINAQLREIRDLVRDQKNAAPAVPPVSPELNAAVLALHRAADAMKTPPPAPPQAVQIPSAVEVAQAFATHIGAKAISAKRTDPIAIIGYIIGSGALAWIVRGFVP